MECVAIGELTKRPAGVLRRVEAGEAIALTRRGAPVALVVGLGLDEAEVLRAYRAARLAAVVRRVQQSARASGADRLSEEEIRAEIDAVRRERAVRTTAVVESKRPDDR